MTKPWGYHLMMQASGGDLFATNDHDTLVEWVKDLTRNIGMVAWGEPVAQNFANHDPAKGGYTVVQLIETSNITAHFVSATGDAYFDIFSCKEFDAEVAMSQIVETFGFTAAVCNLIERAAPVQSCAMVRAFGYSA